MKDTTAAVTAYGSCVDTWLMWSHCAPAELIIVVSDIGEQWSPHTAPAIHADTQITDNTFPDSWGNTLRQIGIRIPNVPHDVPVANARKQAIINNSMVSEIDELF